MPHGTGHHGGAGIQHNYHHHRHFAPHYYQNYDNIYGRGHVFDERGGYSYGLRRGSLLQRRPGTVILTLVLMASMIAAIVVLVYYRSEFRSSSNIHGNTYLSRDTALISYTYEFCDKLTIEGSGSAAELIETAALYLLRSQPSQSQKVLSLNESFSIDQTYKYWMFPLLANSQITINACYSSYFSLVEFDLLRGEHNFNKYRESGYSADLMKSISISGCDAGNQVLTNYKVNYDDKYYFIFDSSFGSSNLRVTINIKQELYTVSADTVVSNCSIALKSRNSCSLSVPLSSVYSKALVQLEPNSKEIDWETRHVVTVRCHARAWLIAVICVSAAIVAVLLIAGIVGYFIFRRLRRQASDSNTRRINNSTLTGAEVDATIDEVDNFAPLVESPEETAPLIGWTKPDEDPPPPYNYNYNTLPPNNS